MVVSGGLAEPGWTGSDNISDSIKEKSNFLLKVLDRRTAPDSVNEIAKFVQATAIRDRNANPRDCWNGNAGRFPQVAKLARHFCAVQASSVACLSAFSVAGQLPGGKTSKGSDGSICTGAVFCFDCSRRN